MPSQVTVTGVTGPGSEVTEVLIENVKSFCFNTEKQLLTVETDIIQHFDVSDADTITVTVDGGNYTVEVA